VYFFILNNKHYFLKASDGATDKENLIFQMPEDCIHEICRFALTLYCSIHDKMYVRKGKSSFNQKFSSKDFSYTQKSTIANHKCIKYEKLLLKLYSNKQQTSTLKSFLFQYVLIEV
jgi:hypothetical protein